LLSRAVLSFISFFLFWLCFSSPFFIRARERERRLGVKIEGVDGGAQGMCEGYQIEHGLGTGQQRHEPGLLGFSTALVLVVMN
jgi:hypothetical protein